MMIIKRRFTKRMSNKIAVLIPCLNEEKTITEVVNSFQKALPNAKVYVCDNGSSDSTATKAKKAGAIVLYEPKRGKGNAVKKMFNEIKADCYLMVDGDNTYMANAAKSMCKEILNKNADMVIGDRLSANYFRENKNIFRGVGNRLARFLINKTFDSDIRDILTGYRAMSSDFVKKFPAKSEGFEIETELVMFALANNSVIRQIPIEYRERIDGSKSKIKIFRDGKKIIREFLRGRREYKSR